MSLSAVVKALSAPILLGSAVTPLVLITKNALEKKNSNLVKTSISLAELEADKSCRDFWNEEGGNKRLYACRNKKDPSKPIFYFYQHNGAGTSHTETSVTIERVAALRYQDTNIHPQLSIRLLNNFQDNLSSYPHWMTHWKDTYLEVEEDCTLNPVSTSSQTITHFYCKEKDKTEPTTIFLDSEPNSLSAKP